MLNRIEVFLGWIEMSSAKVTSGAPVGHTTSIVKLNGVRAASLSSVSASISAVNDSANIGSATEQYLLGGDDEQLFVPEQDTQETAAPIPHSALNGETSTEVQLQFLEKDSPFISVQEFERRVEIYERTVEQYEDPLKKKTQGFG